MTSDPIIISDKLQFNYKANIFLVTSSNSLVREKSTKKKHTNKPRNNLNIKTLIIKKKTITLSKRLR